MKSDDVFEQEVKRILQPKLFSLGFERITLKDHWIYPKFLYEHNDIWFGTSWDWRDLYLEIDLGRLFFFKDALPRVIIIGTIAIRDMPSNRSPRFEDDQKKFQYFFTEVSASLEEKVKMFEVQYPAAFERKTKIDERSSTEEKEHIKRFSHHLGQQMQRTDIPWEKL